ncbi:MAG: cytochrome-c oxidase, cbb3-type subunit II [Phycisphaerales bacterium]|nr:cytochrome-c oxidase, cbb3-type subunit II [Phycisphaerales bacterium]
MWRAFDSNGQLMFGDFLETVTRLEWLYWIRAIGGVMYFVGMVIGVLNLWQTWRMRPAQYEVVVHEAAPLATLNENFQQATSRLSANVEAGHAADRWLQAFWHRRLEARPIKFTIWVVVSVAVASLFEIIPTFLIKSNVPTIATVEPYTPLELAGRDIYIAEGCYNCHSQMIRPIFAEVKRYGEYSKAGEFIYDRPFQWGSRRIGPDLAREGGRQSSWWHYEHFYNAQEYNAGSIMPSYKHLFSQELDFEGIKARVGSMAMLGVPYGEAVNNASEMAREQARQFSDEIFTQSSGTTMDVSDKKVVALIAYMQRLGVDISKEPPAEEPAADEATNPGAEAGTDSEGGDQ